MEYFRGDSAFAVSQGHFRGLELRPIRKKFWIRVYDDSMNLVLGDVVALYCFYGTTVDRLARTLDYLWKDRGWAPRSWYPEDQDRVAGFRDADHSGVLRVIEDLNGRFEP